MTVVGFAEYRRREQRRKALEVVYECAKEVFAAHKNQMDTQLSLQKLWGALRAMESMPAPPKETA